jgi:hypothetical protein
VLILFAAFVMNVRLPLCDEHPSNPMSQYQRLNMFTTACADVRADRSVVTKKSD